MIDPAPLAPELEGYMAASIHRSLGSPIVTATMPIDDRLRSDHESVHPAALLFGIDMAAGMCAGFEVLPRWVLTSDMSINIHSWTPVGELRATARPLRIGHRNALIEVSVDDGDERPIATATINHGTIPVTTALPFVDLLPGEAFTPPPPCWYSTPARQLYAPDMRTVNNTTTASIDLGPATRNPWGVMHGAVLGHLAIAAAGIRPPSSTRADQITLRFTRPLASATAVARHRQTIRTESGGWTASVTISPEPDTTPAVTAHIQGHG